MTTVKKENPALPGENLLATVQRAMEMQTAAIMEAVAVQQEILRAVQSIRIGDDVIAGAAERYEQKMAVVRGGRR